MRDRRVFTLQAKPAKLIQRFKYAVGAAFARRIAMAKDWLVYPPAHDCEQVAKSWGVPPLIAQILINRGVARERPVDVFTAPQMSELHSPELLPGAEAAASLLHKAVKDKERIVIYGDYDVDGTCGVAVLWHVLRYAGADVGFYVPHRTEEGYGLNLEAAKRLAHDGARLIISVDCGISATDVVDALRADGVKVIITDHHKPHSAIPSADAVVHPSVTTCYPNPDLCGAGVAFKLAWALGQQLSGAHRVGAEYRRLLLELLPLSALGTIADVVPLRGENRAIAVHGLQLLPTSGLPGVRALIDSADLTGSSISGYDVGFKLAPRLNAAGRMGHARLAVELLTDANERRAKEIALYLEGHNRARQATERRIAREARETIERENLAGDARRAVVLAAESWHAGVIGIVASRLTELYHRPVVLIALSNGQGQGSARSIRHFDMADALAHCGEHLLSYGGHAMAGGLRIADTSVPTFTSAFIELANNRLTADDLRPRLYLDAEVSLNALTLPTTEAIAGLGPFGIGNPKPRLATGWIALASEPRCVGQHQNHLQASFAENGTRMKGIGFGLGEFLEDLKHHRRCRVAFEPIINTFNGRRHVEMRMIDLKFPTR
ncbi:MAG: single-stranded-DNA-specific exonuclease RecJ [Phycisphaerae bacterium]